MKGDFSRVSFDPIRHFSRVLQQQGRVTLDADANEQGEIILHLLRTLTRDLFGDYGGPANGRGFTIYWDYASSALRIGSGHYYVDGILVECETSPDGVTEFDYLNQPNYTPDSQDTMAKLLQNFKAGASGSGSAVLYLDVWERHVTWLEDDRIREVALNGPDTCTRSKVLWQVKSLLPNPNGTNCDLSSGGLVGLSLVSLAARLDPGLQIKDPCIMAPDAKYRGAENQLYRIEVHQAGTAGQATFKWSRDNGAVATRWLGIDPNEAAAVLVTSSRGFSKGGWVELSDDDNDLSGTPGSLFQVVDVQADRMTVALDSNTSQALPVWRASKHPKVRRWDQLASDASPLSAGAVTIVETDAQGNPVWIDIEDGIQVQFGHIGGFYRSGDYWSFPARVATGDIDWPIELNADGSPVTIGNATVPASMPPQGIEHHYAPLAMVALNGDGIYVSEPDCRKCFGPLATGNCGGGSPGTGYAKMAGAPQASPAVAGARASNTAVAPKSGAGPIQKKAATPAGAKKK